MVPGGDNARKNLGQGGLLELNGRAQRTAGLGVLQIDGRGDGTTDVRDVLPGEGGVARGVLGISLGVDEGALAEVALAGARASRGVLDIEVGLRSIEVREALGEEHEREGSSTAADGVRGLGRSSDDDGRCSDCCSSDDREGATHWILL